MYTKIMKGRFLFSLLMGILPIVCLAQNTANTTYTPKIDQSCPPSIYGTIRIDEVTIMDGFSAVAFTYTTGRKGGWLALSSSTYITANGYKYDIIGWGTDTDPFTELKFDTHFDVEPNTAYKLVMFFPQIPVGVETISIIEPDGFYWKGIHINNATPIVDTSGSINNSSPTNQYLSLDKTTITAPAVGVTEYITVSSNQTWEIDYPQGDMYIASKSGSNQIKVVILKNTSNSDRTNFFNIKLKDGSKRVKVSLSQTHAQTFTCSPTRLDFDCYSTTKYLNVQTKVQWSYEAPDWIEMTWDSNSQSFAVKSSINIDKGGSKNLVFSYNDAI